MYRYVTDLPRLAFCLFLTTFVFSCSEDTSDAGGDVEITVPTGCEIKLSGELYVGGLLPYTGPWEVGQPWEEGILLALSEINGQGGINGKDLGLVTCNSEGSKATGVTLVKALGDESKLTAMVGPGRSAVALGDDVTDTGVFYWAGQQKIVAISPGASNPVIGKIPDDGYGFRTIAHDGVAGTVWARVVNDKGWTKAHYAYPENDAYTKGLVDEFKAAAEAAGGEITITGDSYNAEADANFAETVLTAAKEQNAQVLILSMFTDDAAKIADKWATFDWGETQPSMLTDRGAVGDEFLNKVQNVSTLEGKMYGTTLGYPTVHYPDFSASYNTMYGKTPGGSYEENAYDAVYIIAIAMTMATDPSNGEAVRDAIALSQPNDGAEIMNPGNWSAILAELNASGRVDYDGVAGDSDFNSDGDVSQSVHLEEVKSGSWATTETPCWTEAGPCD